MIPKARRALRGICSPAWLLFVAAWASFAALADAIPATPQEQKALAAVNAGKLVRARTLAEEILSLRPNSAPAHFVLGEALFFGEGNIATALRQYRKARALVETSPWTPFPEMRDFHARILDREMRCLSDLGRYEELLEMLRSYRVRYDPNSFSRDVWPLMKLGRVDQARQAVERALATGDPIEEIIARNGLCAMDGYPACLAMLDAVRKHDLPPGLALRNAAIAAIQVGKLEQAERFLIESTENPDPNINPWRDLAELYSLEGRLTEAVDAAKRMVEFSRFVPPQQRQYSAAEELITSGLVLYLAGYPDQALSATTRALAEPDRAARWSGSQAEIMSEGSLLDRALRLTLSRMRSEVAALLPLHEKPAAWLEARKIEASAWASGRRVLPVVLEGGLRSRNPAEDPLRPELDGALWLLLDAVEVFGPGPARGLVSEELARVGKAPTPVPRSLLLARLAALEVEIEWQLGRYESCLDAAERSLDKLPAADVMLRARIHARRADAARRLGRLDIAWSSYGRVLEQAPVLLRHLDLSLPVDLRGSETVALDAGRFLLSTPRFHRQRASPFILRARDEILCLEGPGGTRLVCAKDPGKSDRRKVQADAADPLVPPPIAMPQSSALASPAARIAWEMITRFSAPRVDLTHSDIRSLDGSPVTRRGLDMESLDGVLR